MREKVKQKIEAALAAAQAAGAITLEGEAPQVAIDLPKKPEHGDFATNLAMLLAKPARKAPRAIAEALVAQLDPADPLIASAEIAGPGFINLRLHPRQWFESLGAVFAEGDRYGQSAVGEGKRVCVEFVSANPTGPMHVGHGRGAVTGDIISTLLDWAGFEVTREYYVNDAGNQIDVLATSVYTRYQQAHGLEVELPEGCYPGDYVLPCAAALKERDGDQWLEADEAAWRPVVKAFAIEHMLGLIKEDLAAFNIRFDVWSSEAALKEAGRIQAGLSALREKGFLLEAENGATLFKSSEFGDDKDRAVIKGDGAYTYLAGDVAYHWDKLQRGFDRLVNVWGADHGGYVPRMAAAVEALGFPREALETPLVQMVNLTRNGQPVRMGKRSGEFVTLREVMEEVGRDATRVFFVQRRSEAQFDFDLELAKQQSMDNPVFYLQYGHARMAAILRKAVAEGHSLPGDTPSEAAYAALGLPEEIALARRVDAFPELVAGAAAALEPHRVVYWLNETLAAFHSYYTKYKNTERVVSDDLAKTEGRLFLVKALKQVVRNGLHILGVDAPEEMHRDVADDDEA